MTQAIANNPLLVVHLDLVSVKLLLAKPNLKNFGRDKVRLYKRIINLKSRSVGIFANSNMSLSRCTIAVAIVTQSGIHAKDPVRKQLDYSCRLR